ncbi:LuxR family transcriptional regulator [Nocardioides guangzhouensis]|uniref:LuxR family transcriptional regulator n=2 Tax=Nocardioides guangzhouensis TaxID=2497878 RepID=A0A4Q4ZHU8_9ACTN|nr:LuxR family transcriptional regulator [Nocardioides guangzhouensis]
METSSLEDLADQQLALAGKAASGRAAHTVHGGHEHALRQTLIALAAGRELAEHESPGEATLQVVRGRVRLTAGADVAALDRGALVTIPPTRHAVAALEDSAVLLTVVVGTRTD